MFCDLAYANRVMLVQGECVSFRRPAMYGIMCLDYHLCDAIGHSDISKRACERLLIFMRVEQFAIAQFGTIWRIDRPAVSVMIPAGIAVANGDRKIPAVARFLRGGTLDKGISGEAWGGHKGEDQG